MNSRILIVCSILVGALLGVACVWGPNVFTIDGVASQPESALAMRVTSHSVYNGRAQDDTLYLVLEELDAIRLELRGIREILEREQYDD